MSWFSKFVHIQLDAFLFVCLLKKKKKKTKARRKMERLYVDKDNTYLNFGLAFLEFSLKSINISKPINNALR